jgi:hypothetical protein
VKACFTRSRVPRRIKAAPQLIDHRFFFHRTDETRDEIGDYTCGVVRKAVADELFLNQQYFDDTDYLKLIPRFIDHPPMTRFFMEYAVLFYLRLNGIPLHDHLGNSMEVKNFGTNIPKFDKSIKDRAVVYHPTRPNFPILDGIIVLIKSAATENGEDQKEQLLLYPYQVTLQRKGHKDSHALFFKEYDLWVADLKEFDVKTEFIWFTGDPNSYTNHAHPEPEPGMAHRSGYVYIHPGRPEHTQRVLGFNAVSRELGEIYENAKNDKESRATKEAQATIEAIVGRGDEGEAETSQE